MSTSQRFGEVAINLGYLTREQIARALAVQEREDEQLLPHRHIGRICVELGFLPRHHVLTILEQQGMMVGGCR